MKQFLVFFCLFTVANLTVPAFAEDLQNSAEYYRIARVQVREVVPTPAELYAELLTPSVVKPLSNLEPLEFDWNAVILIGEKVIQIIQAGQAVVNIKQDAVSVVPKGLTSWEQLAGWQAPMTKVYAVQLVNGFGMDVISLRLKVSAMYGGNLGGRGQYLSNVLVVPTSVNVMWGFTLDLWSENRDPVNAGSVENPVAGLGFDIRYKATSLLSEENGTQDYYLTGNGTLLAL